MAVMGESYVCAALAFPLAADDHVLWSPGVPNSAAGLSHDLAPQLVMWWDR